VPLIQCGGHLVQFVGKGRGGGIPGDVMSGSSRVQDVVELRRDGVYEEVLRRVSANGDGGVIQFKAVNSKKNSEIS
jgi:hypothetical protein